MEFPTNLDSIKLIQLHNVLELSYRGYKPIKVPHIALFSSSYHTNRICNGQDINKTLHNNFSLLQMRQNKISDIHIQICRRNANGLIYLQN